jgi:hypothetical protein
MVPPSSGGPSPCSIWFTVVAMYYPVDPLEPPDSHYLRAAEGWLKLGQPGEANQALRKINPELHGHPDVLEVRWRACAQSEIWNSCAEIGRALVALDPDRRCLLDRFLRQDWWARSLPGWIALDPQGPTAGDGHGRVRRGGFMISDADSGPYWPCDTPAWCRTVGAIGSGRWDRTTPCNADTPAD